MSKKNSTSAAVQIGGRDSWFFFSLNPEDLGRSGRKSAGNTETAVIMI